MLVLLVALATAPPPDWTAPPPGTYAETMAVTGVVRVDGAELRSSSDRVAAFVDGEVRGVTGSTLVGGRRVFFLSVAGDPGDGVVAFRAYDAEADRVVELVPDVTFDPNAPVGTASAPLVWTPPTGTPPVWDPDPADYDDSMTVTATVVDAAGAPVDEAGAVVAAFVGTEVRGTAEVEDLGTLGSRAFLSVYGDAGEAGDVTFRVYRPGPARTFAVVETLALDVGGGEGSLSSPLTLTLVPGVTLSGAEGWRMLAPPGPDASVEYLLGPIWTRGFPGADAEDGFPNVYRYDEAAGAYRAPEAAGDPWARGTGRFVYVFADDDPRTDALDGGFPKTLPPAGVGSSGAFTFSLTRTGGNGEPEGPGWNLLGNPFGGAVDWDDGWTRADVSNSVYVWDPVYLSGSYRVWNGTAGSLVGGVIPAGNAFWTQATGPAPDLVAPWTAQVSAAAVYGRQPSDDRGQATCCGVTLLLASDERAGLGAEMFVSFQSGAQDPGVSVDPYDAWVLTPLAADYLVIGAAPPEEDGRLLSIDARPVLGGSGGAVQVPVAVQALEGSAPRAENLRLSWPRVDLPDGWSATLVDAATDAEVDLTASTEYAFAVDGAARRAIRDPLGLPAPGVIRVGNDAARTSPPRFMLVVSAAATDGEGGPSEAVLSGPSPNPARGRAVLWLAVPSPERVRAVVYDALGRRVAVAFDGDVASTAEVAVDVSRLAAGAYVVRVEGASFAEARRLTVVR